MLEDGLLFSLLAGATIALPVGRTLAASRRDGHILPLALLPIAVGLAVWCGIGFVQICARLPWSEARLAPAVGLWKGWPLYSPADSGPINGWIYGPVAPLLWSPAALAATPASAVRVAAAIDVLLLAFPLVLASLMAASGGWRRLWAALLGIALLPFFYPTWYALRVLGTDSATVALGATACLVLAWPGEISPRRFRWAAILTVLAAWSKLVEGLLPAAQLLWLALGPQPLAARRYFRELAIWGLVISGVILLGFGPQSLVYNMWTIPGHHPFQWGGRDFAVGFAGLLGMTSPLWIGLGFAAVRLRRSHPALVRGVLLFALAAIALVPLGLVANAKLGGDRNSLHSGYYLLVAAVAVIAQLAALPRVEKFLRWLAPAGALTALVLTARDLAANRDPGVDATAEAFAFARDRPGQVYFPWNPLVTLMADGTMSHFEYGVVDRLYGGAEISPARLARDMPPRVRWIAYPTAHPVRHLMQAQFPQFNRVQRIGSWTLYSVGTAEPAPAR